MSGAGPAAAGCPVPAGNALLPCRERPRGIPRTPSAPAPRHRPGQVQVSDVRQGRGQPARLAPSRSPASAFSRARATRIGTSSARLSANRLASVPHSSRPPARGPVPTAPPRRWRRAAVPPRRRSWRAPGPGRGAGARPPVPSAPRPGAGRPPAGASGTSRGHLLGRRQFGCRRPHLGGHLSGVASPSRSVTIARWIRAAMLARRLPGSAASAADSAASDLRSSRTGRSRIADVQGERGMPGVAGGKQLPRALKQGSRARAGPCGPARACPRRSARRPRPKPAQAGWGRRAAGRAASRQAASM